LASPLAVAANKSGATILKKAFKGGETRLERRSYYCYVIFRPRS
jgi:hypothetical protein